MQYGITLDGVISNIYRRYTPHTSVFDLRRCDARCSKPFHWYDLSKHRSKGLPALGKTWRYTHVDMIDAVPSVALLRRWLGNFDSTVRCRYNAVIFLPNPYKIHPIVRPLGRGMGCILMIQTVIYTLRQSLQWCVQHHVILDRVITTPDCISYLYVYGDIIYIYLMRFEITGDNKENDKHC